MNLKWVPLGPRQVRPLEILTMRTGGFVLAAGFGAAALPLPPRSRPAP